MVQRRLTPVGKLFLGLMLLFYGASVTSQSGLLLLLIGLIGGCFIVNFTFSSRNVANLRVTPPQDVYIEEGGVPTQPWRFENPATKHAEVMEIFHGDTVLFRLPVVETKSSVSVVPKMVYERRGVYPNARVTIASAAPYGLLSARRQLQLPGEVVVFPRVYQTDSPAVVGSDMVTGGRFRGGRRVNSGTNFSGVRGWQAGDSLKQVHWKSTAKRGELMVKTFEEELGGRVSLVLDCSAVEPRVIDNAVRAAASLGVAALQEGHHVEFFDLVTQPPLRLAPFSDEGEFLDLLSRYTVPAASELPALQNFWRRSSIVLVGTAWKDSWHDLITDARAHNRIIELYLPEGAKIPANLDAEIFIFSDKEIWERVVPAYMP